MPESNTLLYAFGGLIGAEALGITNFSGGGSGSKVPRIIPIPSGGGGGGTIPVPIDTGGERSGPNLGTMMALRQVSEGQQQMTKLLRNFGERERGDTSPINIVTGGGGSPGLPPWVPTGPGGKGPSLPPWLRRDGGGGGGGGGQQSRERSEFHLQDLAGTGPVGTSVATGAEILDETGGVFSKIGSPATPGNRPRKGTLFGGIYDAGQSFGGAINLIGAPGKDPREGTFFGAVNQAGRDTGTLINQGTRSVDRTVNRTISDAQKSAERTAEGVEQTWNKWTPDIPEPKANASDSGGGWRQSFSGFL